LNAEISFGVRVSSEGGGREIASNGVGEDVDNEGNESKGPETVMIDPKEVAGISGMESLGDKAFLATSSCFSLHHHSPNSVTTLPPCANPNKCILFSGHLQSVVRCVTTLSSSWIADVGFGLGMSSPRWSKEVYHWYASSYRNGILWYNETKGGQRIVSDSNKKRVAA